MPEDGCHGEEVHFVPKILENVVYLSIGSDDWKAVKQFCVFTIDRYDIFLL